MARLEGQPSSGRNRSRDAVSSPPDDAVDAIIREAEESAQAFRDRRVGKELKGAPAPTVERRTPTVAPAENPVDKIIREAHESARAFRASQAREAGAIKPTPRAPKPEKRSVMAGLKAAKDRINNAVDNREWREKVRKEMIAARDTKRAAKAAKAARSAPERGATKPEMQPAVVAVETVRRTTLRDPATEAEYARMADELKAAVRAKETRNILERNKKWPDDPQDAATIRADRERQHREKMQARTLAEVNADAQRMTEELNPVKGTDRVTASAEVTVPATARDSGSTTAANPADRFTRAPVDEKGHLIIDTPIKRGAEWVVRAGRRLFDAMKPTMEPVRPGQIRGPSEVLREEGKAMRTAVRGAGGSIGRIARRTRDGAYALDAKIGDLLHPKMGKLIPLTAEERWQRQYGDMTREEIATMKSLDERFAAVQKERGVRPNKIGFFERANMKGAGLLAYAATAIGSVSGPTVAGRADRHFNVPSTWTAALIMGAIVGAAAGKIEYNRATRLNERNKWWPTTYVSLAAFGTTAIATKYGLTLLNSQ